VAALMADSLEHLGRVLARSSLLIRSNGQQYFFSTSISPDARRD
jgi:hypothetical protein